MSQPPLFNEWSNEKTFKFIELLAGEPAIWDPKNKQYKLKHKVHDAWVRIGEVMSVPIEDLKAKKSL
ncbi:hypothetical protein EVAR_10312_1 [Eumeta japonica]|uniref:MADF domain-containing protein n=1 Tax=Eumeta variegata TaxID=151549 RepID=A0A4C1TEU3_EUMVA|nr:hypothetical protein EVAR_10312_1 [Eumeta japonica]